MNSEHICPKCAHLQPSGKFKTHPMEKHPLQQFRVQSKKKDGIIVHGYADTLVMAQAIACGTPKATILIRKA